MSLTEPAINESGWMPAQTMRQHSVHVGLWLDRSLRYLQMAVSAKCRNREWVRQTGDVIASLEQLNKKTEADFIAVGESLMAFLSASRTLHGEIKDLSDLVSGDSTQGACQALLAVRDYIQDKQRREAQQEDPLLAIHGAAGRVHRSFSALRKISFSFQITATLAKIETAHLSMSEEELNDFSSKVRECSNEIKQLAEQAQEAAADFEARVTNTRSEADRLLAIERKELPDLLAAVEADLALLAARQEKVSAATEKFAVDLDAVTKDLGAIATSIQFHDITRQQVEHIAEALSALLRDAVPGALSLSGATVARLQKAQLTHAALAFAHSTGKIDNDLAAIAAKIEEMDAGSKSMLGADQENSSSFLDTMQGRIAGVLRAMRESHALEKAKRAVVDDLENFSKQLRASNGQVKAIELQLSRMAINASICASHIGDAGEPLNVVAAAMRLLQVECTSYSDEADAALHVIDLCMASLASEVSAENAVPRLVEELEARLQSFRSMNAATAERAVSIAASSDALRGKLQGIRTQFAAGALFAEAAERCGQALEKIAAEAQSVWSFHRQNAGASVQPANYTMNSEREIYESVVNNAASGVTFNPDAAESKDSEVEFF